MTNDLLQVLRGQRVDGRTDAEVRAAAADEIERLRGNLSLAEDGLAAAMQENQRLKEAVAKFGDHASSCAYRLAHYKGPVPACDCGWNEYVAGLSHEPGVVHSEDDGSYTFEDALRIARLWRAGKMIGGDEDQVIFALLRGIEAAKFIEQASAAKSNPPPPNQAASWMWRCPTCGGDVAAHSQAVQLGRCSQRTNLQP